MTDHKAEAEKVAQGLGDGSGNGRREQYIAEAQLHATLYLAEQQRLANGISYLALSATEFRDATRDPDNWVLDENFFERRERIQAIVREGLGLS